MTTTILTTCKGRLAFLEQTVPTWLEMTPFDVLVVDYGCPDKSGDWACHQGPRVAAVNVTTYDAEAAEHVEPRYFNRAKALQAGLTVLAERKVKRVLIMDADARILSPVNFTGDDDEIRFVRPAPGRRDLTGLLAASLERVLRVGGPNDKMEGWGVDDIDLRLRLYLRERVKVTFFGDATFEAIAHDDAIRVEHYEEKNRAVAVQRNFQLMWNSLTRAEFDRVMSGKDPNIDLLLGSAASAPL